MRTLVSWIGATDLLCMAGESTAATRNKVLEVCKREKPLFEKGPIRTLLDAEEFEHVYLLCNFKRNVGSDYVEWLKRDVSLHEFDLHNPTDYAEVFSCVDSFLKDIPIGKNDQLCFHLSPGTPAMAAIWVLLGKSRYPAKFFQTYENKSVQTDIPFDLAVDFVPTLIRDADSTLQHLAERSPQDITGFDQIIGDSSAIRLAVGRAAKAAIRDVAVLIQGESGTGKEMFARAIHLASRRSSGPFVPLNCAAIPRELLESELFGHKKGAFTGASEDHTGAFEQADGGTLFLDEIGECDPAMQSKLLRALQPPPGKEPSSRVFRRVGETKDRAANVRVIAATNRDLMQRISQREFREDLYYRIGVICVKLPSLRDRSTDIPLIANALLDQINREFGSQEPGYKPKRLSSDGVKFIRGFQWPGNVRQLQNALTQAAVMTNKTEIGKYDLLAAVTESYSSSLNVMELPIGDGFKIADHLDNIQRHYISRALEEAQGVKSKARRLLGISSDQTFAAQIKRLRIKSN